MIRVLHVPIVKWQATDGIARACRELAAEMPDIESTLVVDREPGSSGSAFSARRVIRGWTPTTPWQPAFARVVRELRPDVVHLHGGELTPVLAFSPALRGTPVVVTCYSKTRLAGTQSRDVAGWREHRINASPARAAAGRAGLVWAARRALATGRIGTLCTSESSVEVEYAAAGPVLRVSGAARVSPFQARWSDAPVVVFAGRAQSGRGVDDLIAAFDVVRAAVPHARLRLLLLPGGSAPRWQAALAPYPWADVRVGPIEHLDAELAACHVGAFPFRWSVTLTPALAAAEAMAVGLPLVVTTVDCLAPLVDPGVNGYLVPPEDPVALGHAIARILRGPAVWQPLAEGARKSIEEHWSWAGAATVTRDAYKLAIRRHQRGRS